MREGDLTELGMEHARTPDRGERHLTPPQPGLVRERVRDLAELRDQRLRTANPGPFVPASDDLTAEVGEGGADPGPPDVDPDDPAGPRVELVQHRARPLAA